MKTSILALAAFSSMALASTNYPLPDPAIAVNPNYSGNTTIVTIAGVTYRGLSQYYYQGECSKPDGPKYHCDVMSESGVVLTEVAVPHRTVVVNLTVQFASVLSTSGHNQWLHSTIVLAGDVTTP